MALTTKNSHFYYEKCWVCQKDGWKELTGAKPGVHQVEREAGRGLASDLGHCNQVPGTTPANDDDWPHISQTTGQDLEAVLGQFC